ncbi:hypothetical protein D1007_52679 [Hordeum vulgare]|nr:hypothetical protein D1007_52679 [Hordeum vulgare]
MGIGRQTPPVRLWRHIRAGSHPVHDGATPVIASTTSSPRLDPPTPCWIHPPVTKSKHPRNQDFPHISTPPASRSASFFFKPKAHRLSLASHPVVMKVNGSDHHAIQTMSFFLF